MMMSQQPPVTTQQLLVAVAKLVWMTMAIAGSSKHPAAAKARSAAMAVLDLTQRPVVAPGVPSDPDQLIADWERNGGDWIALREAFNRAATQHLRH